ncbi:ABC transporter permease [Nesterenkonia pannonica]|uniref:ABC transporter permease n=1 Tax=Nesterenkonia pannonica TaxID=1548602 RepID=UPI0021648C60|nr:ABC transporter permease [Nesterenkonia pannonica]
MLLFFAKRLGAALTLLVAVSFVIYMLLYPAAGNIAANVLGENATQEQVSLLNEQLGLDRPLPVQYGDWLLGAATGDLGVSYFTSQPVADMLAVRLPVTLSVVALVMVLTALFAFAIGTYAGIRRGRLDRFLQLISTLGDALPNFIIAIFLVTFFALQLGWFPATGYTALRDSPADWALSLTLPVAALTISGVAAVVQQVRSATIGVLQNDYIRTLRSRGLSERRIIFTSVLKNSSTNGLTALGVQIVGILGGAVVIEQVFALPGLGSSPSSPLGVRTCPWSSGPSWPLS